MTKTESTSAPASARLDTLVAQAQAALQANDSGAALALSRAALRIDPEHDPALEAAWRASMAAQRWDWALLVGERWCRVHPQELGAWQACLVPQLLLHRAEVLFTTLQSARQAVGTQPLLDTLEALGHALVGDDARSATTAAQLPAATLQACATSLLGAPLAALLAAGWQPPLLRAFLLYEQQVAGVWAGRERLAQTLEQLATLRHVPWPQLRFVSLTYAKTEATQIALVNRMAAHWPSAGPVRLAHSGRLRVAYLSPCLGSHATTVMMGLVPHEQDHALFQLFAYGHAPGRSVDLSEDRKSVV